MSWSWAIAGALAWVAVLALYLVIRRDIRRETPAGDGPASPAGTMTLAEVRAELADGPFATDGPLTAQELAVLAMIGDGLPRLHPRAAQRGADLADMLRGATEASDTELGRGVLVMSRILSWITAGLGDPGGFYGHTRDELDVAAWHLTAIERQDGSPW